MIREFTTSRCTNFGHAEFRFKVDDARVIDPDVTWFTTTLEDWVSEGARFADGETIQMGWGLMKVRAASDRTLNLLEPDYESMPIEWVDTVSSTLAHLRLQKDVSESFFDSDETDFPSLRFHGIVCSRLKDAEGIVMERLEGTPSDSGWFIGCDEDESSSGLIRTYPNLTLRSSAEESEVAQLPGTTRWYVARRVERRTQPLLRRPTGSAETRFIHRTASRQKRRLAFR